MPIALQEQIKTNFFFHIFIIWLRHRNWYSCTQSLMTAFESFSVSLARTVFFSKQKCKLLSVVGSDINQENEQFFPMPFIGNSLCHLPPIISPWSFLLDKYVQKYGSATSTFALNSHDLWLCSENAWLTIWLKWQHYHSHFSYYHCQSQWNWMGVIMRYF